jgi:hypothetical protein
VLLIKTYAHGLLASCMCMPPHSGTDSMRGLSTLCEQPPHGTFWFSHQTYQHGGFMNLCGGNGPSTVCCGVLKICVVIDHWIICTSSFREVETDNRMITNYFNLTCDIYTVTEFTKSCMEPLFVCVSCAVVSVKYCIICAVTSTV